MFNFFHTIFGGITSLIASAIIAVGLVSIPTTEMAVVQNPSQPPQNEEIVTLKEKTGEPIKQTIEKEKSEKRNAIPAVSVAPVIPPPKTQTSPTPTSNPTPTPTPTPTPDIQDSTNQEPQKPSQESIPKNIVIPAEVPSAKLDITPPIISNIKTSIKLQSSPTTDSIIIEWSTNEPTLGTVNFGGNMSCSINGCQDAYSSFGIFKQSESYELDHQIIIDRDLEPATEYKYYIYATDKTGNETGFYDGKIVTELPIPLPELKGQYNIDLVLTKNKSPYTVTGDVFINKKLQIEPGVEIKFNGDYELVVNGELGVVKVNGTKNEPVLFELNQSIDTSNRGILIRSNNDNIIDNTIIESGYQGISVDSGKNGKRAKATISNSTIKNNVAVGIFVNNSDVKIINNNIIQNRIGIQGTVNSISEIFQNNISDNSFIALTFTNGATPQLKFNNIYGNNDIVRIHADSGLAHATLSQNNISLESNTGYIYLGSGASSLVNSSTTQIDATDNWWSTTDISAISQRIKKYNFNALFNYQPVATSEIQNAGVQ